VTFARFVALRLAAMAVILAIVSLLVFSLLALTPGDPAVLLLGPNKATPESLARIRAVHGLDDPFLTQYTDWVRNAIGGDFGRSIRSGQRVTEMIGERVGVTAWLAVLAFILTIAVALPFGLTAGMRKGRPVDRIATATSLIALALPSFAVGFLLIYIFAVKLSWFPAFGRGDGFVDTLHHMALPAVALAMSQIAIVLRQTRAATMDIAERDYVTFAKARAVPRSRLWRRYVLQNASLPVLTSAGLVLAYSLTGAVLVENVFALQGLGTLLVTAVSQLDLPLVQALAMFTALLVLITNLVVDVLYFALDPRLRRAAVAAG
jgi:peptide/nickel transport system permease protein